MSTRGELDCITNLTIQTSSISHPRVLKHFEKQNRRTRFVITCLIRNGSPTTKSGTSGAMSKTSCKLLVNAFTAKDFNTERIRGHHISSSSSPPIYQTLIQLTPKHSRAKRKGNLFNRHSTCFDLAEVQDIIYKSAWGQ